MPYKDSEKQKQVNRERMQRVRGNTEKVTQPSGNTGVTLWPPSKFLSPEDDMKMQERVIEAIGLMSSSRLASFRELNNVFTPNKVR